MSADGKRLTPASYYSITPFTEDLFLVSAKGSLSNQLNYGLVDNKGKLQLSNAYFDITSLDSFYLVSEYNDGKLTYGVFSPQFELVLNVDYLKIEKIGQVFAVLDTSGFWYFYDQMGRLISDSKVDEFQVQKPYVLVRRNGAVGLLDSETRTFLYPPVYKEITSLEADPVTISAKSWRVLNWSLDPILELEADSISSYGELLVAAINGGNRFYADSLEILVDRQLELVSAEKGHAIAKTDDVYAVFNYSGEKILEGDSVYFDGSYFFGLSGKEWDIYNLYGRKINLYPLQAVMPSQSQYIPVKRAGQWGLLDFSGKQIVSHVYDSIGVGSESYFPAKYVGSWGVINAFGNWLVQPTYFSIERISDLLVGQRRGFRTLLTSGG